MSKLFVSLYILFTVSSFSQEIQWSPFVWYSDTVEGKARPKVALLIPCRLQGISRKFLLQFDTGSNASLIQEGPRKQYRLPITWADSQYAFTTVRATLGHYRMGSTRFWIRRDARDTLIDNDPYPVIGTLGEDFLAGKVFILDFPHDRFSVFDSLADVPDKLLSRVSFTPLSRRNEKLFVTLHLGDTVSSNFFFDSGASVFPIETTREMWQRLTGRQGTESSLPVIRGTSWGKGFADVGAPLRGGVRIGTFQAINTLVYYDSSRVIDFKQFPFKTDGLFGNALFYDKYTVVLDLIKNRFGILKE